ncbi:MAG: cell wall hydrolase, partial [bacterium]
MKRWIALAALLVMAVCALMPTSGFTEDVDTVRLARAIYALARGDSYDAKLAIGTLAMNRVENPWFGDTLGEVLDEQHQFPMGSRYDAQSLAAAHEVLSGRRSLDPSALYYQSTDAAERR